MWGNHKFSQMFFEIFFLRAGPGPVILGWADEIKCYTTYNVFDKINKC
jgi:hypothetical protein